MEKTAKTANDFPELAARFADAVGEIERTVSGLLASIMGEACALLQSPESHKELIRQEIDAPRFAAPLLEYVRNAEAHTQGAGFAVLRQTFLCERTAFRAEPLAYLTDGARAQLAELVEMADGVLDGFLDICEARTSAELLAAQTAPTEKN